MNRPLATLCALPLLAAPLLMGCARKTPVEVQRIEAQLPAGTTAEITTDAPLEAETVGGAQAEAQAFLDRYHAGMLPLYYAAEAQWAADTRIVPGDETNAARAAIESPYTDATKTHINDDAAQYYDYALSYVMLFQFHDHIARNVLGEDRRDTNYYGREEVGDFLATIMAPGATVDGDELLEEATGQGLYAEPMLTYFQPLMDWLQDENAGRAHTLPKEI